MANKIFKNKSILLAITSDRGFYTCFKDNLDHLAFDVKLLRELPFSYKNTLDKVVNFFHKTIFNNKKYKEKLIAKNPKNITHQNEVLNSIIGTVDYSLTIRPDLFTDKITNKILSKSKVSYAYQWDGIQRFPKVIQRIPLFKKFYVFDKEDEQYGDNTKMITNFYFDCYSHLFNNTNPEYDVYYIGTYDSRITELIETCSKLHQMGLKLNIIIICNAKRRQKLKKYPFFNLPEKPLSYKENLIQVANTKAILEIGNTQLHSGLSFRTFEALGYDKKLITNNTSIIKYDFYSPNNFHIYENNKALISFMKQPKDHIDSQIKNKYSFTNWIKEVLEIV